MKPYYDDGHGIVIYHGDCRDILPTLGPVDLALTDPPYSLPHVDGGGLEIGTMSEKIVKSACGAANLLAAITGEDSWELQQRLGLRTIPLCPVCNKPIPYNRRTHRYNQFCSEACRHRWFWPLVECEECHKLKEVKRSALLAQTRRYKRFYCSHKCAGAYIGRTYGFAAHPENTGASRKGKSKYDLEAVWQKHLETGWGAWRLAPVLGIPYGTLDGILRKMRASHRPGACAPVVDVVE